MSVDELIDGIHQLASEQELYAVFEAARAAQRNLREVKAQEARRTLKRGDRVRLTGLSPQYLNGLTGVIDGWPTGKHIPVRLDHPTFARRYAPRSGQPMRVPLACIEVVHEGMSS